MSQGTSAGTPPEPGPGSFGGRLAPSREPDPVQLEITATWGVTGLEPVLRACLARDGSLVACGQGSEIGLYEPLTGLPLPRLKAGRDAILSLALAPDASWLVAGSGSADEWVTLRLYRRGKKWKLERKIQAHYATTALAIAPDGEVFASGGGEDDGSLKLWSAEGNELWSRDAEGSQIAELSFSPDGRQLAVARWGGNEEWAGQTELWSREGQLLWAFPGPVGGAPRAVGFSPDGQHVLSCWPEGLHLLRDGASSHFLPGQSCCDQDLEGGIPACRAWFGQGLVRAGPLVLGWGPDLKLWRDGELVWRLAPLPTVQGLAVTRDRILTAGKGALTLRDLQGNELASHPATGDYPALGFSLRAAMGAWGTSQELVVLDLRSGDLLARSSEHNLAARVGNELVLGRLQVHPTWQLDCPAPFDDLVAPLNRLDPEGVSCFLPGADGLRKVRLADGLVLQAYPWSWFPQGSALRGPYLTAWNGGWLARWNPSTGELVDQYQVNSTGMVAFTPSGERALVLWGGWARLWDFEEKRELSALNLMLGADTATALGAVDERTFLAGTLKGLLHRLELRA